MKGVQFVVDENGQKTAVVINLKQHSQIWEDFYDTSIALGREREPRESLEDVKRRIARRRK